MDDYATLRSVFDDETITAEFIRQLLASFGDRLRNEVFVAVVDGKVVGFSRWARFTHDIAGKANISSAVLPEFRGRGIGDRLHRELENSLLAEGLNKGFTGCLENASESLRFAQQRGYREHARYFESNADLAQFPSELRQSSIARIESLGLEAKVLKITSPDDPFLVPLYDLFAEADMDEPMTKETGLASFEHFCGFWKMDEVQRGLVVVAAEGSNFVAMSYSGWRNETTVDTQFTGVRRAWRGKGLAQAVKSVLMAAESERGTPTMSTSNNSLNAPMLAVNEKLGFKRKPAWIVLTKDFA